MFRVGWMLLIALTTGLLPGCGGVTPDVAAEQPSQTRSPQPIVSPGLHNTFRLTDWLLSGSRPEGDSGFLSLQELGVRTIISVDGDRPDTATARQRGLRYVHIPIGYDGIPQGKLMQLVKAARDLPRPIYVHCHHGKHRGPAAAVAIQACLDDRCTIDRALATMRTLGTDSKYRGLFASVQRIERPSAEQLDAISDDFPETAPVSSFVERMVEIDHTWDRLQKLHAANWKIPTDESDLDPADAALQLVEHYREAARLSDPSQRSTEMQGLLRSAEESAIQMERTLRELPTRPLDPKALEPHFQQCKVACATCHAKFRDAKP